MRLLLSKPDALGDQLIIAGIVQRLAALHPDWTIIWHVRPVGAPVASLLGAAVFQPNREADPAAEAARLLANPDRLVFLPCPLDPYGEWTTIQRDQAEWWHAFLQAGRWDCAVLATANRTWVGELTIAATRATRRLGFRSGPTRQPLVNEVAAWAGDETATFTETIDASFDAPEGIQLQQLLGRLDPALAAEPPAAPRLAAGWQPQDADRRPIALAPGVGADARRAWGLERFRQLAESFRASGHEIVWIIGPADDAYWPEQDAGEEPTVWRFGHGDLIRLAERLTQAKLLVCHDTAYAHLAAAVGVPTLALYGAGQRRRFHPVYGRVKVLQSRIACEGCQWHCLWDRMVCVADLPAERVLSAAQSLLAGDPEPVEVTLPTPLAHDGVENLPALRRRLQDEILALNADRFARLQIIQSLLLPRRIAEAAEPPRVPKLSVIIPMGRPDRVALTLGSLIAQAPQPTDWEIVVVGVAAQQVADTYPQLPIIPVILPHNVLPPRTRCLGVERATGDWYLFVDDDVELAPDTVRRWLGLLRSSEFTIDSQPVGAIGFRLPGRSGRFFEQVTDISNFWAQQHRQPEDRDWLYSAAILVKAEAYRKAGGFNPDLPNGEDVDLTRRIAAAGYRLRYEPALVAKHDHRRDTLWSMWRYFWRNGNAARYFFAGHGGACAFSVKTAWLKSWSDLRMNQAYQRERGHALGWKTPLVWLNYLIVELSLEYHWQAYLYEDCRYRELPTRSHSDVTYMRAMEDWTAGRRLLGAVQYALAVLRDFGNPVRR